MPETSKSKRYEALCFKRSLEVADLIISQRSILYEQGGLSSRQETRKRREEGGKRRNLLSFFKVLKEESAWRHSFREKNE
jgi:hypothetical protein